MFGVVAAQPGTSTVGQTQRVYPDEEKAPHVRGFPSAPERTRTSPDHTVHKALNLDGVVSLRLLASESSRLRGSIDGLDASDRVDVATGVATIGGGRRAR